MPPIHCFAAREARVMCKLITLTFLIALFLLPSNIIGQDISAKTLPSVAAVTVQKADGTAQTGMGFLAVRDGIMVTAFHLVRDAKRVTARFPSGDEYECSGIIDKDEVRNTALVRVKVFGKPLLKMAATDQTAGAKLNLAAIKEGAFGMLPVTLTDTASKDGMTWAILAGDVPLGNSGAPLLDDQGNVVGMLTLRKPADKIIFNMIPAQFILALDTTLPTQPWGRQIVQTQAPAPTPSPKPADPQPSLEEIDVMIAKGYYILLDNMDVIDWADVGIKGMGYLNGVPGPVYEFEQNIDTVGAKLAEIKTEDPVRAKTLKTLLQLLGMQKAVSENFIKAVVIGGQQRNWGTQAQDAHSRATAQFTALNAKIAETAPDLVELEKVSPKFRELMVPEFKYRMAMEKRPSGFRLGVNNYARRPFFMLVVYSGGLANEIGLMPGDTILTVAGQDMTKSLDFEAFKLLLKQNLGKKLDAIVERNGKVKEIKLKIPKAIPEQALIK